MIIGIIADKEQDRIFLARQIIEMKVIHPCAIFLEIPLGLDSHESSSKANIAVTYSVFSLIKAKVNILWTAKYSSDLDKRVRLNTDTFVLVQNERGIDVVTCVDRAEEFFPLDKLPEHIKMQLSYERELRLKH